MTLPCVIIFSYLSILKQLFFAATSAIVVASTLRFYFLNGDLLSFFDEWLAVFIELESAKRLLHGVVSTSASCRRIKGQSLTIEQLPILHHLLLSHELLQAIVSVDLTSLLDDTLESAIYLK